MNKQPPAIQHVVALNKKYKEGVVQRDDGSKLGLLGNAMMVLIE